ncbi:MAG: glycosyltransferase family 9 protein [Thermoleophilaceae bacterium]
MEQTSGDWQDRRDVLCVRLDAIGDVLMSTPAIRALRRQRADRRITLLTSRSGAQAAALVPEIDRTIAYDPPWMKAPAGDDSAWRDCAAIERLRACDLDAAAIFTVFSQSPLPAALTCHLAGIPRRLAHCRENPYRLLTDWVRESEPEQGVRHEVQRQLDLVDSVGARPAGTGLSLEVPEDAAASALAALRDAGQDPAEPWLLLHPGATAPPPRYPLDDYAEAMRLLARRTGRRVVIAGGAGERAAVAALSTQVAGAVTLAGDLSFAELCGLIAAAPVLVCNNSAPAHVAAAVGTPVLVLYALTNPQHTPWQARSRVLSHDVPCRWCYRSVCPEGHHACLRRVPPADVAAAALELLAADGSDRAGPLAGSGAVAPRIRCQPGEDAGRGDGEVQEVVGGVDGNQPDDVVAVDEAPDRHDQVDGAEAERVEARRGCRHEDR